MIISRTPFRVSFFGGGTDFPAFYEKHGGVTLSTTNQVATGRVISLEREVFPAMAAEGCLMAVRCGGPLMDMGTPVGLARADMFLNVAVR